MADLVVWKKPPPLVSKGLFKKATKLSTKEKLWVYDDLIGMGIASGLFVLSLLWLVFPYTMQDWAIVLLVLSSILFATCLILCVWRTNGVRDPLLFNYTSDTQLSYRGRRELCLLDRNRKRAPGWERSWRMPDIEHNQYSVWVTPHTRGTVRDKIGNEMPRHGLMFRIIEHRPIRYGWGPRQALVCTQTRYAQVEDDNGGKERVYAMNAERFEEGLDFDAAIQIQHDLEKIADWLEGYGYDHKVKSHEMERIALQLRR
jgi:hypothetical protein